MPRAKFDPDMRSVSIFDRPQFTLKKDERARIVMIDGECWLEWTHWVTGVGYIICLGDPQILADEGSDSDRCPLCANVSQVRGEGIGRVARRFAAQIIRYSTDANMTPTKPVMGQLLLWRFGNDKFNQLASLTEEWGDLRSKDLLVTCVEAQYSRYNITVANRCYWVADEASQQSFATLYKANKIDDLSISLGRKIDLTRANDIVRKILTGTTGSPVASDQETQANIPTEDLLAGVGVALPPSQPSIEGNEPIIDFDQLLSGIGE